MQVGLTPAAYSALASHTQSDIEQKKATLNLLYVDGDVCISPISNRSSKNISSQNKRNYRNVLYKEMIIDRGKHIMASSSHSHLITSDRKNSFQYGYASIPGYRISMEDAVCILQN